MKRASLLLGALGVVLVLLSFAPALNAGTTAQAVDTQVAQIEYGRALFMAKGCVYCHRHNDVADSGHFSDSYGVGGAPDLSTYRWTDEYLHTWLKDPKAVKPNTMMPNLELKLEEIEALIAFLSADAQQ